jgi:murein L,D-transpeptidase YafK
MPSRCGILTATRIVVHKSRRELLLLRGESILRSYRVALGAHPTGHKEREGDGRTPEGCYTIDRRNPKSAYHLSLHVSYPNQADCDHAEAIGAPPGGDIMIHGLRPGVRHPEDDWTQGCIAVTDEEMDEIWNLVPDGTPIEIRP